MKLIVIKNNLKEALFVIEKTIGDNQNLPILKNVLINVSDGKIKLTTTNLESAVSSFLVGKIIQDGTITVPVGTLSTIINNLQTERINLEAKGTTLIITTDNYHATLQGLPPEDFPLIPLIKNTSNYIELPIEVFHEGLTQVVAATQFSDLHPELNSILFNFSLDSFKLAATDSFRLAEKTITQQQFTTTHTTNFKALIPLKITLELLRVFSKEGNIKIFHDENQILFSTSTTHFISRLIEGNFPDYHSIIPNSFSAEILVNRAELLNAIKLAAIFGSKISEVKLKISSGKKVLEVFSASHGVGENTYLIPYKGKGDIQDISFNWRYLHDGLKVLFTEDIQLSINQENKPSLLKSPTDPSYFYILMPVLRT